LVRYELVRLLKSSDRGDIRLVRDESGRLLVQRYRDMDRQLTERLCGLKSPYVAAILGSGEDEDGFYTIEEYIDGTAACDMQFTARQATDVLLQLCSALRAVHNAGVVHRDIKPANLMIDKNGRLKLIDFDTARLTKQYQSHDTGYLGTIGYAPPEQYGFMQTDCRADIYAFGMTMQELLCDSADKPAMKRIVRRCTAFDPERRYSDISLVERAIRRAASKLSAVVTAVIGAVAVVIVIGAVVLLSHKEPDAALQAPIQSAETTTEETLATSEEVILPTVDAPPQTEEVTVPSAEATTEEAPTLTEDTTAEQTLPPTEEAPQPTEEIMTDEVPDITEEAPEQLITSDMLQPNRITYETLQDENGRNYDSFDYVFYDDPTLYGEWKLLSYIDVDRLTAQTVFEDSYPHIEEYVWQLFTVHDNGVCRIGYRDGSYADYRWTNGYLVNESGDGTRLERLFTVTLGGVEYLMLEQKPMGNLRYEPPHRYLVFRRLSGTS